MHTAMGLANATQSMNRENTLSFLPLTDHRLFMVGYSAILSNTEFSVTIELLFSRYFNIYQNHDL